MNSKGNEKSGTKITKPKIAKNFKISKRVKKINFFNCYKQKAGCDIRILKDFFFQKYEMEKKI